MDLELDDEQRALVDSVRSVLATAWPVTSLRSMVEQGSDADHLWSTMVALDWPALCVPRDAGGMGYGPVEAMLINEGCGRAVAAGPFFTTTALFAPVVSAVGTDAQARRWLPQVAAGELTGTAAIGELRSSSGRPTVDGIRRDGGWELNGICRSVIEASRVSVIAVPASSAEGVMVAVVPAAQGRPVPIRSVDASRELATVTFDGVFVESDAVLGDPGDPSSGPSLDWAVDHAVVALAAELVGTCTSILDMVLEHARQREQFGVKIGSFQALKHRLADCFIELEAARSSVRVASIALGEQDARRAVAASSAMALAGDCARRITGEGIQILGGIGFTWEHDIHLLIKRALGSSVLLGSPEVHRQRVADLIGLVPT
ncbi:MAG: acyl-CoA/acyl-ACP dehydrogenase [Actinomycetota bacterium]|nr:acyl-CoA/acyl-ACP dehydrogenase [Actinomycetota bacterium]